MPFGNLAVDLCDVVAAGHLAFFALAENPRRNGQKKLQS
jgi:hypothetical protein